MQKLTIGIISFNTKDLLAQCLDSISEQSKDFLKNTLVIDNSSTDGSQQMVKDKYSDVLLLENKENRGFAHAANQIIKQGQSDYVLVLNADTILHDNSIDQLINFLDEKPEAGAVGPLLLNQDGTNQPSGRRFPSFIDASVHAFLGVVAPNNRFSRRYKLLDWDRNTTMEVDWISGAAICVRKNAVADIDFFDEQYFMYVEDMDLCYRLWQNGWKVFLLTDARVTHYIGQSSKQVNVAMIKEFEKSIYRFFVKQNANSWKRLLSPLVRGALVLRSYLLINVSKMKR